MGVMKTAKEIINVAIGEASMCWSEIPKGIFESANANKIAEQVLKDLVAVLPKKKEGVIAILDKKGNKYYKPEQLGKGSYNECIDETTNIFSVGKQKEVA